MPPYAQLHQRLQWITTLNQSAIGQAFSKAEIIAMLRHHSIFVKASLGKSDCALEVLRLINAGGLSQPDGTSTASAVATRATGGAPHSSPPNHTSA